MGTQTLSVRLSEEDAALALKMVEYHQRVQDIPEATPSAYLRYLLVKDVETVFATIKGRRAQMGG